MRTKSAYVLLLVLAAVLFTTPGGLNAALINFDNLSGTGLSAMANVPGTTVPTYSQLSTQFLSTYGVAFSSAQKNYVAVVAHYPPNNTTSNPNIIGGANSSGVLSYGTSIIISFFDPTNSATKAVTNSISIWGDMVPLSGASATMTAYGVSGNFLGSVSDFDSDSGLTLSLSFAGIHKVVISQSSAGFGYDGTIGFDDLSFNAVQAVPIPAAAWLLGTGLVGLVALRRRFRG